ncbi:MAG: hypothetical protein DRQ10_08070 [Candidatus Hydrothermota bacterium]|nr:MAG: hypothetical protein DRQ10_08070 [Candidatus Hydrothermae bacterium]
MREAFAESVLELFVELTDFYEVRTSFYLTGGTALSGFYLGHRVSYDMDMFTRKDLLQLEMGGNCSDAQKPFWSKVDGKGRA